MLSPILPKLFLRYLLHLLNRFSLLFHDSDQFSEEWQQIYSEMYMDNYNCSVQFFYLLIMHTRAAMTLPKSIKL